MRDDLGTRMKEQYENRTRYFLPRRSYTIVRIDGKSFHTYTRKLPRPYDLQLMQDMADTAKYLCENMQGASFAFVQSDEISVLLTDFAKDLTSAWFDGNIQKIASISASLATAKFNQLRPTGGLAQFDARCFTIPDPVEVQNYFVWRQKDATRNSVSMAAQSVYSHKQLLGKSQKEMQELLFQKGINWNDYPATFKRGQGIFRTETGWVVVEVPVFTRDRDFLKQVVPVYSSVVRTEEAEERTSEAIVGALQAERGYE